LGIACNRQSSSSCGILVGIYPTQNCLSEFYRIACQNLRNCLPESTETTCWHPQNCLSGYTETACPNLRKQLIKIHRNCVS